MGRSTNKQIADRVASLKAMILSGSSNSTAVRFAADGRKHIDHNLQDLNDKSDRLAEQVYRQAGYLIAEQSNVDSERHQLAEMLQGKP